jgi:two-component system phosphate regulon response regulator PhoB
VDVQIVGLRKKLGSYGQYVETVRGVGYRFKESP